MMNTYQYNNTDNYYYPEVQNEFSYVDSSDAESRIYQIIKNANDKSVFSSEVVNQASDWPSFYHLTSMRSNILRPFVKEISGGRTLELGAGCGAITRFIGELGGEVVALEGSPARARIIGNRCSDLKNVTVIADLIQNYSPDDKFDVVTLIGVLEYSQVYINEPDPVNFLIKHAKSFLKENGLLLIAIENQLGLKYLCGAPEDHLGYPMFGINDSYTNKSAITFGRKELTQKIQRAGFSFVDLFVPVPDYKTPVSIIYPTGFSDASQAAGWDISPILSGSVVHDRQRTNMPTFSLENAWGVVGRNGLAQDLANSFLFAARMTDVAQTNHVLAAHYGGQRPAQFAKETQFILENGGLITQTRQVGETSALANSDWNSGPYHSGKLWFDELLLVINRPGWCLADLSRWAGVWIDALRLVPAQPAESTIPELRHFSALLPANHLDATPTNFIMNRAGEGYFFDLEWNFSIALPVEFVVLRGLFLTLHRVTSCALPAADVPMKLIDITKALMQQHNMHINTDEHELFMAIFNAFQNQTQNITGNALNGLTAQIEVALLPVRQLFTGFNKDRKTSPEKADKKPIDISFLGPLYHDYAIFGAISIQHEGIFKANQMAKEPIIRSYLTESINKVASKYKDKRDRRISFAELFCADGYYTMLATCLGADSAIGYDNDSDPNGFFKTAPKIAKALGINNIVFQKEDMNNIKNLPKFSIVANIGGLYHVSNPEEVLVNSYEMAEDYLIIQTVVSMENDDDNYFITPAPGWTWGSRFSRSSFDAMIKRLGFKVISQDFNELQGNPKLSDRGSVYYLIEK